MNVRLMGDLLVVLWAVPAIGAWLEYLFVRGDDGRALGFRRSPMGVHLMSYMGALAFLGVLAILRLIDDGPVWGFLRLVGFIGLIIVTWWRWYVVHQARVEGRPEPTVPERGEGHEDLRT